MKRLIAVLSGLLVLPAFAEVAPIYYDEVIEYSDMEFDDDVVEEDAANTTPATNVSAPVATVTGPRSATGRTTASRAVPASGSRAVAPTRTVTTRESSTRNATTARTAVNAPVASRATSARATVSRPSATNSTAAATVSSRRATGASNSGVAARAAVSTNDTVNNPIYIGNSARVGVRASAGVSSRTPTIRMAAASGTTSDTSVSNTMSTADMDELAQITDFCKAQYTQCMDNFCNVLDDNQGRCSCSKNLKNYAATEAALEKATEELQEVAQKIQYIGLSADEITTLFTQTEAELTMQSKSDSTQLKNDLDRIKGLIIDVKSGTASSTADTGLSLDLSGLLDFTVSSTGFDLSSMFGTTTNTSSISNQRGEQLYKTATSRCKASVLNTCAAQGVDISLITNAYDLEIDKQCILYERSLTETNTQMASTVRNAKSVLQKARLMVAQQKNQYDLRGCINALDSCMQDDFVCGTDYESCLDPTGKWIVNGNIVVGSTPGVSGGSYSSGVAKTGTLYSVWDYDNTSKNVWTDSGSINGYISTMGKSRPVATTTDMMEYLRAKIGYIENGKTYGLCSAVLNKCQDLTFTGTGNGRKFEYDNEVIKEYMQRTLIQIKAQQDKVLAEYADSCISDVASCLAQNNYNYSGLANTTTGTYSDVAINACMATITTCKSVTSPDNNATSVKVWLNQALNAAYSITQAECIAATVGGQWNNDKCTKEAATLTFTYSPITRMWIATSATSVACAGVQNATFDSTVSQCTTSSVPTAVVEDTTSK